MKLLLKTNFTGDEWDGTDVTHALVDISPERILEVREKLKNILSMPGFYSVSLFDFSPIAVTMDVDDYSDPPWELPDWFDDDEYIQQAPDDFVKEQCINIDASTIRYKPDGIMWHFYEKHCAKSHETETIPWSTLEDACRNQESKEAPDRKDNQGCESNPGR